VVGVEVVGGTGAVVGPEEDGFVTTLTGGWLDDTDALDEAAGLLGTCVEILEDDACDDDRLVVVGGGGELEEDTCTTDDDLDGIIGVDELELITGGALEERLGDVGRVLELGLGDEDDETIAELEEDTLVGVVTGDEIGDEVDETELLDGVVMISDDDVEDGVVTGVETVEDVLEKILTVDDDDDDKLVTTGVDELLLVEKTEGDVDVFELIGTGKQAERV
jgi:hypothetical protein